MTNLPTRMQKSRPSGVTVLAYWALVGSVITYAWGILLLTPGYDSSIAYSWPRVIAWPLGAGYAVFYFTALPMSAFFAWVFVYTLMGRKTAWFANVGMSLFALVQFAIMMAIWVGNTQNIRYVESLFGSPFFASEFLFFVSYLSLPLLRLYYLFRPHVRNFFDAKSLSLRIQST